MGKLQFLEKRGEISEKVGKFPQRAVARRVADQLVFEPTSGIWGYSAIRGK